MQSLPRGLYENLIDEALEDRIRHLTVELHAQRGPLRAADAGAVTGDAWTNELREDPQDYVSVPAQPWLDGYCVEKGTIRQFVAMPLGAGYSAEEQLTGAAEHGGIQLVVHPMKATAYEKRMRRPSVDLCEILGSEVMDTRICASLGVPDMGLAPGGRMRQEIVDDPHGFHDWDQTNRSRCFVHIANSRVWEGITGTKPPVLPVTAKQYADAGLPWFDYYAEGTTAVEGSGLLAGMDSVATLGQEKRDAPLPDNASVEPARVIRLGSTRVRDQVREGEF